MGNACLGKGSNKGSKLEIRGRELTVACQSRTLLDLAKIRELVKNEKLLGEGVNTVIGKPREVDGKTEYPINKGSPLIIASERGYVETVKVLVSHPRIMLNIRCSKEKISRRIGTSFRERSDINDTIISDPSALDWACMKCQTPSESETDLKTEVNFKKVIKILLAQPGIEVRVECIRHLCLEGILDIVTLILNSDAKIVSRSPTPAPISEALSMIVHQLVHAPVSPDSTIQSSRVECLKLLLKRKDVHVNFTCSREASPFPEENIDRRKGDVSCWYGRQKAPKHPLSGCLDRRHENKEMLVLIMGHSSLNLQLDGVTDFKLHPISDVLGSRIISNEEKQDLLKKGGDLFLQRWGVACLTRIMLFKQVGKVEKDLFDQILKMINDEKPLGTGRQILEECLEMENKIDIDYLDLVLRCNGIDFGENKNGGEYWKGVVTQNSESRDCMPYYKRQWKSLDKEDEHEKKVYKTIPGFSGFTRWIDDVKKENRVKYNLIGEAICYGQLDALKFMLKWMGKINADTLCGGVVWQHEKLRGSGIVKVTKSCLFYMLDAMDDERKQKFSNDWDLRNEETAKQTDRVYKHLMKIGTEDEEVADEEKKKKKEKEMEYANIGRVESVVDSGKMVRKMSALCLACYLRRWDIIDYLVKNGKGLGIDLSKGMVYYATEVKCRKYHYPTKQTPFDYLLNWIIRCRLTMRYIQYIATYGNILKSLSGHPSFRNNVHSPILLNQICQASINVLGRALMNQGEVGDESENFDVRGYYKNDGNLHFEYLMDRALIYKYFGKYQKAIDFMILARMVYEKLEKKNTGKYWRGSRICSAADITKEIDQLKFLMEWRNVENPYEDITENLYEFSFALGVEEHNSKDSKKGSTKTSVKIIKKKIYCERLCPRCLFPSYRNDEFCKHTFCGKCGKWFCHVCLSIPTGNGVEAYGRSVTWPCGTGACNAWSFCGKDRKEFSLFQFQTKENESEWIKSK